MFSYSRQDPSHPASLASGAAPEPKSALVAVPPSSQATKPARCSWLDEVRRTFRQGFVCGIKDKKVSLESPSRHAVHSALHGVFLEGAAMSSALLDAWTPWKRDRWRSLLDSAGERHGYQIHVGLGMGLAQANQGLERHLHDLDPLLRWLVVDGFGFYHGIFDTARHINAQEMPSEQIGKGHLRKVFDQGLGRSLWFSCDADVESVIAAILAFPRARQRELWSGVGVAATLAGGADGDGLARLAAASGRHREHLAQGAAFAAHVQSVSGAFTDHADFGCRILSGFPAREASGVVDKALRTIPAGGPKHLHETWQSTVRKAMSRGL